MNTPVQAKGALSLSLDEVPPILVPLRFFLTAPLFGVLAALALLWAGPGAWLTRWSATVLAATHLMTLGFITMVMFGALMQMLPVLAGAPVPRPRRVSRAVHALLGGGTLLLAGGMLSARGELMRLALPFLVGAFGIFLAAVAGCLVRARAAGPTVGGMRLAATSLAIAVTLGVLLAAGGGARPGVGGGVLIDLHLSWGLLGWVGLLVIGVAYQVIPMFQMTPEFPRRLTRWLAPALFGTLTAWSLSAYIVARANLPATVPQVLAALLTLGYGVFAVVVLILQYRRRRGAADVTLLFWRVAGISLAGAAGLWLAGPLWPAHAPEHRALLWGVLVIVGFCVSVINGMLYKIVPFLVWLHLQRGGGRGRLSNMKEIIPDRRARHQYRLHIAALCLLIAAAWEPAWFARAGALAFGLSCLLLWRNLVAAYRMYRKLIPIGP